MLGRRAVVGLQLQQSPLLGYVLVLRPITATAGDRPTDWGRLGIIRPLSFEIGARQRAKLTGAVVVTCPGNQVWGWAGRSTVLPLRPGIKPGIELSTGLCTGALAPWTVRVRLQATTGASSHPAGLLGPTIPLDCRLQFPNRPESMSNASSRNPGGRWRLGASSWLSMGSGAMSSVTDRPASAVASSTSLP